MTISTGEDERTKCTLNYFNYMEKDEGVAVFESKTSKYNYL